MEKEHSLIYILLSHHLRLPSWVSDSVIMAGIAVMLVAIFAISIRRRLSPIKPSSLQAGVEVGVEALEHLVKDNIGEEGEKYLPFIGSLFIYILILNLLSVIPGFVPPTMDLNVTLALAGATFLMVQYSGIKKRGFIGYLKHLSEWHLFEGLPCYFLPLAFLGGFFFAVLHTISEFAKPFSLALRLFANMFGEETLVLSFVILSPLILKVFPIPLHFPFLLFHMFIGALQAFIFTILSTIYLAIATED